MCVQFHVSFCILNSRDQSFLVLDNFTMKYFFACLLLLCLGLTGCHKGPDTEWFCATCKESVDRDSKSCPHCGTVFPTDFGRWD